MRRRDFIRLAAVGPLWLDSASAYGGSDPRERAVRWLVSRQSPDGSWRSDTYGAFRDGRALTPVVLRAIGRSERPATEKACGWLVDRRDRILDDYPVHLGAAVMECAAVFPRLEPLTSSAFAKLLSIRCPLTGGWSYSPVPPPAAGERPPMQQPNLSATAMAIDGLRAAGVPAGDPLLRKALEFVRSCQNFGSGDEAFDDGGFFQMPADVSRNKAGGAGSDSHGTIRFHSYPSATADGLRALLACGEPPDALSVLAAAEWLRKPRPERTHDLVFYSARSMAATARLYPPIAPVLAKISSDLAALQRRDGSWRNPAGEMREDCPVVATALAAEAMAA